MSADNQPVSPVEMAHFKFGVIAPVIQGTFPDASEAAYYRRVTQEELVLPNGTKRKFSPDTLEKWTGLFRRGGYDALMPAERRDKGTSRTLGNEAATEIFRLKEAYPRMTALAIHTALIDGGFISAAISPRAVQRFIRSNNLKGITAPFTSRERLAFEMAKFGELWQADTAYLPFIRENGRSRRTYLVMILDDHSRMIVGGEIFYSDNAYNYQKVLKDSILTYGIPDKLYMDNGSVYRNEQLMLILGSVGIVEAHTPVRDGASKGKVERNFRTLRTRWLSGIKPEEIASLADFNRMLKDYIRQHNTTIHSVTGERPIDRFMATKDHPRIPKSREWLEECFLNREERKVRNDSCISLQGIEFNAPAQFIGMKVEVRFAPDRLDDAFILYNGIRFPLKRTNRVVNGKAARNKNLPHVSFASAQDSSDSGALLKGGHDAL